MAAQFTTHPPAAQHLLDEKAREHQRLYEQYGKPLEATRQGEYIAISLDGQIILGVRAADVVRQAIENFGSGNFSLARIGHRATFQCLSHSA